MDLIENSFIHFMLINMIIKVLLKVSFICYFVSDVKCVSNVFNYSITIANIM